MVKEKPSTGNGEEGPQEIKDENPKVKGEKPESKESKKEGPNFNKKDLKEFNEFIQISLLTGELPEDYLDKFDEQDKEKFYEKFRAWQEEGKPKPEMPKSIEKHIIEIVKVYRARDKGKEYLYWVEKGKSKPTGIKEKILYRMVEIQGKMVEDRTLQIGVEYSYTIKYDEAKAKELIKKAKRDTSNARFYIKDGIGDSYQKHMIRDTVNFTKPFEDLIRDANLGKRL